MRPTTKRNLVSRAPRFRVRRQLSPEILAVANVMHQLMLTQMMVRTFASALGIHLFNMNDPEEVLQAKLLELEHSMTSKDKGESDESDD